jgi:hypothetical protein
MHVCSMYGSSSCAPSSPSPLSPSFDFCCSKKRLGVGAGVVVVVEFDELSSRASVGGGAGQPPGMGGSLLAADRLFSPGSLRFDYRFTFLPYYLLVPTKKGQQHHVVMVTRYHKYARVGVKLP